MLSPRGAAAGAPPPPPPRTETDPPPQTHSQTNTRTTQVLQSDGTKPAPKAAAAASAGKPAAKKENRVAETSSGGISPQAVALPGALAVIAGGAFAISKLDEGFFEFMEATSAKDSGLDGAGYETLLKAEGGLSGARAGTKKVKAKASGGGGGGLGGFFGKK